MRAIEEQRFPILSDIKNVHLPKKRKIERVYIHCSDSDFGDAELIDEWHKGNGWNGIGYNFVVTGIPAKASGFMTGIIQVGRDIEQIPAHVKGDNEHSIGICIIGKFEEKSPAERQEVNLQWDFSLCLVTEICTRLNLPFLMVRGHREANYQHGAEHTSKTCPGKKFDMDHYRASLWHNKKYCHDVSAQEYQNYVRRFLMLGSEHSKYKKV